MDKEQIRIDCLRMLIGLEDKEGISINQSDIFPLADKIVDFVFEYINKKGEDE